MIFGFVGLRCVTLRLWVWVRRVVNFGFGLFVSFAFAGWWVGLGFGLYASVLSGSSLVLYCGFGWLCVV